MGGWRRGVDRKKKKSPLEKKELNLASSLVRGGEQVGGDDPKTSSRQFQ